MLLVRVVVIFAIFDVVMMYLLLKNSKEDEE